MADDIPIIVVDEWIREIRDIVSAPRFDGQKKAVTNRCDRALAELGKRARPSFFEKAVNWIGLHCSGIFG